MYIYKKIIHTKIFYMLKNIYFLDLTKRLEKKLDGKYTKILHAVLNKSWKQFPTKQLLYSHLFPISQTIIVR